MCVLDLQVGHEVSEVRDDLVDWCNVMKGMVRNRVPSLAVKKPAKQGHSKAEPAASKEAAAASTEEQEKQQQQAKEQQQQQQLPK